MLMSATDRGLPTGGSHRKKLEAVEAVLPLGLRRGRFKAPDALIRFTF